MDFSHGTSGEYSIVRTRHFLVTVPPTRRCCVSAAASIPPLLGCARCALVFDLQSWSQRLLCERRDVSCRWVAFLQSTAAQFRVSCRPPGFRSIDRRGHHRRIAMVVHFSGSICDTWSDHDFCGPGLPNCPDFTTE